MLLCWRFPLFHTRDTCYSSVYTSPCILPMYGYLLPRGVSPRARREALGGRSWFKRGILVALWCLDLYFCRVHTQMLLCCNITMIYPINGEAFVYSTIHNGESTPIRDAVSIVGMKSAHEAWSAKLIRNVGCWQRNTKKGSAILKRRENDRIVNTIHRTRAKKDTKDPHISSTTC